MKEKNHTSQYTREKPQIRYNRLRKHHVKYANCWDSSSLGPFFGFCCYLGRLPRAMAPHGHFGDISMVGCSLSGWVGAVLCWLFVFQPNSKNLLSALFRLRYFEFLEILYFWKVFCHKAAWRYNILNFLSRRLCEFAASLDFALPEITPFIRSSWRAFKPHED